MKKEVKEDIIDEVTVKEEPMYKKVNHKSNKNIKRNKSSKYCYYMYIFGILFQIFVQVQDLGSVAVYNKIYRPSRSLP